MNERFGFSTFSGSIAMGGPPVGYRMITMPYLFLVSLFFVHRSFYGMRILSEEAATTPPPARDDNHAGVNFESGRAAQPAARV